MANFLEQYGSTFAQGLGAMESSYLKGLGGLIGQISQQKQAASETKFQRQLALERARSQATPAPTIVEQIVPNAPFPPAVLFGGGLALLLLFMVAMRR